MLIAQAAVLGGNSWIMPASGTALGVRVQNSRIVEAEREEGEAIPAMKDSLADVFNSLLAVKGSTPAMKDSPPSFFDSPLMLFDSTLPLKDSLMDIFDSPLVLFDSLLAGEDSLSDVFDSLLAM